MIGQCPGVGGEASLLQRLSGYVECHAEAASRAGFDPALGGALSAAILTSCLILYVALIGYRMMLGQTYDPRAALLATVRAGVVIAFSSSWASYQPVIQAVVLRGPAEIASTLMRPSGLELGEPAKGADRLQSIAREIRTRSAASADPADNAPGKASGEPPAAATASAYLALRLTAGVLLGLGPLLLTFALFDITLGVVEGWIRALLGVLLGSAAMLVVSTLELGFVEAELARVTASPTGGLDERGLGQILAIFGMAGWASLVAAGAIAWRFRFRRFALPRLARADRQTLTIASSTEPGRTASPLSEPARARSVAEAVIAQGRRERAAAQGFAATSLAARGEPTHRPAGGQDPADTLGLRRAPAPRRSVHAPRRERRS